MIQKTELGRRMATRMGRTWSSKVFQSRLKLLFLVGLAAYGYIVRDTVVEVKRYRERPTFMSLERIGRGELPHNVLARYLLLQPGDSLYDSRVREHFYRKGKLRDNYFNRWLLKTDITRMEIGERQEYLPEYPFPIGSIRTVLEETILSGAGGCRLMRLLPSQEWGLTTAEKWIDLYLNEELDLDLALDCVQSILRVESDHAAGYLRSLLGRPDFKAIYGLIDSLETHSLPDSPSHRALVEMMLQGEIRSSRWSEFEVELGGALISDHPTESTSALLDYLWPKITAKNVSIFLGRVEALSRLAVAKELGHREKDDSRGDYLGQIYDVIARADIEAAEEILNEKFGSTLQDSELKKRYIVTLVNHNSRLGLERLDEAFVGQAPRRKKIESWNYVLHYSKAVSLYEEIAGHGYLETGKQWPPAGGDESDPVTKVREWSIFLNQYPWFPGADDAAYHLAYQYYRLNQHAQAYKAIEDSCTKELIDRDAGSEFQRLLYELGAASSGEVQDESSLQTAATIGNLGVALVSGEEAWSRWLKAVEVVQQAPNLAECLGISPEETSQLKSLIDALDHPDVSRLAQANDYAWRNPSFRGALGKFLYGLGRDHSELVLSRVNQAGARSLDILLHPELSPSEKNTVAEWRRLNFNLLPSFFSRSFEEGI